MGIELALIIAAVVAAVGGGVAANAASKRAAKTAQQNTDSTIAANKAMAEYSYSKDLEMWNKANEFNSPESQMLRLKQANLSPNLVYGQGAIGNASAQLPKFNAPDIEYGYKPEMSFGQSIGQTLPDMLSKFQDFAMRQSQIDSIKAQTRATDQGTTNAGITEGILSSEREGAPTRVGLFELERQKRQRENRIGDTSEAWQLSTIEERARSGNLMNQRLDQELGLGKKRSLIMDEDLAIKKFQNEWAKEGVTGHDNLFMRMLVRQFPNLFSSMFSNFK